MYFLLLFCFVLFFVCAVLTRKQSGRIEERKRRIANEEWEALRASSSQVKSNQSRLKSVRVEPSQVESTQFKSSKVGFVKYSQVRSSQVESSEIRSGQLRSGQVESSQVQSCLVTSSQPEARQIKTKKKTFSIRCRTLSLRGKKKKKKHSRCWWLFSRVRGFRENVQPFIPRPSFFFFFTWRLTCTY